MFAVNVVTKRRAPARRFTAVQKGPDMKPGNRVRHRETKQRGEVLVTYTRPDGAAGADWKPDGQSTREDKQADLQPER